MASDHRRREIISISLIVVIALIGLIIGWKIFWFISDDAYISFRYISNSMLGYGYVWNPPPFRPVEGYSNFLWMVLLENFWRLFDLEPPETANNLSLVFSMFTLVVFTGCILKLNLSDQLKKYRIPMLAIALFGIVTNRTILAWTSSGLETAMYYFLLMLWIYRCVFVSRDKRNWGVSMIFKDKELPFLMSLDEIESIDVDKHLVIRLLTGATMMAIVIIGVSVLAIIAVGTI